MNDYYILSKQRIDRDLAMRRWRNTQYAQEILGNENAQPRGLRILLHRMFGRFFNFRLPRHAPQRKPDCPTVPCGDVPLTAR